MKYFVIPSTTGVVLCNTKNGVVRSSTGVVRDGTGSVVGEYFAILSSTESYLRI